MFPPFLPPNRGERTRKEGLDEKDDIGHITKADRTRFTGMVSPPSRMKHHHLPLPLPFLPLLLLPRPSPTKRTVARWGVLGSQEDFGDSTRRSSKVEHILLQPVEPRIILRPSTSISLPSSNHSRGKGGTDVLQSIHRVSLYLLVVGGEGRRMDGCRAEEGSDVLAGMESF